ncbi:MAG TPA: ABC transporter substrate-binding protein [Thermoleophilia bacterium]|nr:ABC transporter substrate-binding protein [Thermoleophilia bacterium]
MRNLSVRSRVLTIVTILALAGLAPLVAGCGEEATTSSASPSASAASPSPSAAASWTASDLAAITTDSALTALLPADIQSAGEIKCLSDIPYPPWEYFDPPDSTNPAGFDYDLSQALGKKLGVTVKFIDTPFDSILLAIKAGKGDIVLSGMYDNRERQDAGYSFVDYTFDGTGILVAKGNPSGITNLDSLAGKTVTVESGATQQGVLEELNKQFAAAGKPEMTIQAVQSQPEALLKVKGGTAVADLTDWSTALNIAATTNEGNTYEVVRDPAAPYLPQMDGIAMLTKNTQLVDAIQKALQALIDEGAYQKIVAAWGFVPVESAQVNAGPAYAASHPGVATSPSP